MKTHELRVVDERKELEAKIEKLEAFINSSNVTYLQLGEYSKFLLCRQLEHMQYYKMVLDLRIAMFKAMP